MKFIDEKCSYSPETKITTITLADKHGTYIGEAKLHPNDTYNEIIGGNIAANRAYRNKLKEEKREIRIKLNTLKSFRIEYYNYIKAHPSFISSTDNTVIFNRLDIAIKRYEKALKMLTNDIEKNKIQEKKNAELRKKIRAKMNK